MKKNYYLGNIPIMFGDTKSCGYCKHQVELLKKLKFVKGVDYIYRTVPLGKTPKQLKDKNKKSFTISALPTWYVPTMGNLRSGFLNHIQLKKILKVKRKMNFGSFTDTMQQIGTLTKYGKNFPDNEGFKVQDSFSNQITDTWKDPLLSGTLGRELGPNGTDQIYSNNYYNNIRMAYPGGDLDTTLNLNKACNQFNPSPAPNGGNSDPITYSAGMIYNSPNPQITSFGIKKTVKKKTVKKKKPLETIDTYKSYINNERFKRGEIVRCMGKNSVASLGNLSCDTFNNYSRNYNKFVPLWEKKIALITKGSSFGQRRTKISMKQCKSMIKKLKSVIKKLKKLKKLKKIKAQKKLIIIYKKKMAKLKCKKPKKVKPKKVKMNFGYNLYTQIGPVPAIGELNMDKYAGGLQNNLEKSYNGSNKNYYINSSPIYYPVSSKTSFGKKGKRPTTIKLKNGKITLS